MKKIDQKYVTIAFLVVFVIVGLSVSFWLLRGIVDQYTRPIPVALDQPKSVGKYIVQHDVSEQVTVAESIVAQKVDLQRKMIVPDSPSDIVAIKTIVEKEGGTVVQSSPNSIVVELPKQKETDITQQLEENNLTDSLEVDYPVYLAADSIDWGTQKIEVPPVWSTTKGNGVRVAVIDTGIDYNHPDLQGRYVTGYDFVNDDSDPFDDNGHGTHVSGTIAANANDSGIQGVAAEVSLYEAKVLASDGVGYISDIVDAVDWAIQQNVQVINFSLGTSYYSEALNAKLQEAQAKGIYLVAAAGNTNGGALLYPAAYDSVISVAATDSNDNFASFSSIGAEVAAPGVSITSTTPYGGYGTWSGTSMAAPHVTASVALMLSNDQTNIRERLHQTALDLGVAGQDAYFGYGRIVAKPAVLGEDVLAPAITFLTPQNNSTVDLPVSIALDIQDENKVVVATLSANLKVIAEWSQEPYTIEWDAAEYADKEVTLVASVMDDSGNIGAAQVTITPQYVEPSPSPEVSQSPTASASAKPKQYQSSPEPKSDNDNSQGKQGEDSPADDKRQDIDNGHRGVPVGTNINQRNPQPTPVPQPAPSAQQKEEEQEENQNEYQNQNQGDTQSQEQEKSTEQEENKNQGQDKKPEVKGASTGSRSKFYIFFPFLF